MNTTQTKAWSPQGKIDSAANASVLAAGVLVVLVAAATMHTGPDSQATQIADARATQAVMQDEGSRIVVIASRSERETKTGSAPARATTSATVDSTATLADPVLLAASALTGTFPFNERNPNGDHHAR
jgi:hypothetical protein